MANSSLQFKTNYAVSSTIEPFYKGGKVQISKDEKYIFCTCGTRVNVLQIVTGKIVHSIEQILVTASKALLLKQWDWKQAQCTRSWRAIHNVPIASMTFDPTSTLLATGGCDGTIKLWDVVKQYYCGIRLWDLRSSHSGRDKICTVWDLKSRTAKRTVPVYEAVESVVLLPEEEDFSEIGTLPSASSSEGSEEVGEEYGDPRSLTYCLPLPSSLRLATVTAEHNILLYQLPSFTTQQQFVGYNDEVLDVKFLGKGDTHIVVATNSSQLKVFELATSSCQILYGHTDTVLSLDVFKKGSLFVSCAKDKSVRVWRQDPDSGQVCCVAQGSSHANAVGSITCSSVAVSPNDKLLASGSQDRLAKLWSLGAPGADLALLGVFRGHRRGVWCVQFSPMDQVLASSSADGSVKLWSLQDFSCLKLWTIKTNECVKTLDAHQDKVWGLHATRKDDRVVTASADSNITVWTDVTEVEQAEEQAKQEDQILNHTLCSKSSKGEDGAKQLEKTVLKLRQDQKELLLYQGARAHLEGLIPYTERHMQRIGRLLQASMFLDYMWQKMRVTGAPASMDSQDEEMDTASLQVPHPLFMIDKRSGEGGDGSREQGDGEERWNEGVVEEDGGLEEDTNFPANMEDDDEVSITRKASVSGQRVENGQNRKENGSHPSGSEESSGDEEEEDQGDQTEGKMAKCQIILSAASPPPLQAITS
ncbi:unnamed protein product [Coregonus sp. 'balchen']|nr:unnamed protein product [Coregonus sp. 'balchen']